MLTILMFAVACALVSRAAADPGEIRFNDVTDASGLNYISGSTTGYPFGIAVAVGDYDGDGRPDVLATGSPESGTRIFRNSGNGRFADVSESVLPPDVPNATMALFADMDNDGDPDLLLARWFNGDWEDIGFALLENVEGVYRMASASEIGRFGALYGGMAAADVDNDGFLDVVITHWNGPAACLLNTGALSVVDGTAGFGAGLGLSRPHWAPAFADYNNDGLVDLHIAIDYTPDYQCRNLGNGTFADVSREARVNNIGADMGLAIGDIENDGDLDIYSTNIGFHCLYVNDGTGRFQDLAEACGVRHNGGGLEVGWGTTFSDYDLDGDEDLVFLASSPIGSLFENDGTGHFTDVTTTSGLHLLGYSLLSFDYDLDGDLDLLIAGTDSGPTLYENVTDVEGRHWLSVFLRGTVSNAEGVGARVYATAGGVSHIREVMCGYSFYSCPPVMAHFGLGTADTVERLRVRWPSGIVQDLRSVPADREIRITEALTSDLTGDARVDLLDLNLALLAFGGPAGDCDGDGDTDMNDVRLILLNFGLSLR